MNSTDREPKTMSSRLLTMKFMQRNASANLTTSKSSQSSTPNAMKSPTSPAYNLAAVQKALLAEEAERLDALQRNTRNDAEIQWTLDPRGAASSLATPASAVRRRSEADDDDDMPWRSNPSSLAGRRKLGGKVQRGGREAASQTEVEIGNGVENNHDIHEGLEEVDVDSLRAKKRVKRETSHDVLSECSKGISKAKKSGGKDRQNHKHGYRNK